MTVAEKLQAEARDYRSRAIAAGDQQDDESAIAFKIVAVVLHETAQVIEHELEHAA